METETKSGQNAFNQNSFESLNHIFRNITNFRLPIIEAIRPGDKQSVIFSYLYYTWYKSSDKNWEIIREELVNF